MKPKLSLKGRGLQWLAQREHSRSELRQKLLRHARADFAAQQAALSSASSTVEAPGEPHQADDVPVDLHEPSRRRTWVAAAADPSPHCGQSPTCGHTTRHPLEHSPQLPTAHTSPQSAARSLAHSSAYPVARPVVHTTEHTTEHTTAHPAAPAATDFASPGLSPLPRALQQTATARSLPLATPTPEHAVDAVLDWLEAHRYLSEERFVESRVHARAPRYGNLRIRQELAQHGVSLSAEEAQALRASELARAREVWRRKFGVPPVDAADRARQMRFLAGRGFSPEAIRKVVQGAVEDD